MFGSYVFGSSALIALRPRLDEKQQKERYEVMKEQQPISPEETRGAGYLSRRAFSVVNCVGHPPPPPMPLGH